MPYSAPLDGIRALAILAVLIFHIRPESLRGGFIGVDVFFVLSGFLISSILLHDLREGSFRMREFYLRRLQRLMPNILATLGGVVLLWALTLPPSSATGVGRHGCWTLLNASNVHIHRVLGGYWGDGAAWAPLLHTWSLAIEEQFYLVFPGALLLLSRCRTPRIGLWLGLAFGLSLALCLGLTPRFPDATFYLLPTRVWELLLGSLLAIHRTPLRGTVPPPLPPAVREPLGWCGLALILLSAACIHEGRGFPGAWALAPTLGTALLILGVADGDTRIARLCARPALVGIGKRSYSLYLWHWPLIVYGRIQAELHGASPSLGAFLGGLASLFLAGLAYATVEQPFRQRGPGRGWRLATITAGFALLLGTCWVLSSRPFVPDPRHRFDPVRFQGRAYATGKAGDPSEMHRALRYQDVAFLDRVPGPDDQWREGGRIHRYGGSTPEVVVLGSSHALMYSRLVDDLCRELGLTVAFLAADGTPPFFSATLNEAFPRVAEAKAFDEARRHWLRTWHPRTVLVMDRWDRDAEHPERFQQALGAFLQEVSPQVHRIGLVTQVPVLPTGDLFNPREYVSWRMGAADRPPRILPDSRQAGRDRLAALAEAATRDFPNLRVLRADRTFRHPDGSIRWQAGRAFLYADDDHLSEAGAEEVRGLFREALREAAARS